jgi:hypothetical protein
MADFDLPAGPPKSLIDTITCIREAQARKAYLALRPYVDPDRRDQVIDLLLNADALLAANAAALQAVQHACPDFPRQEFDLSPAIVHSLGLFSQDVKVAPPQEDRNKEENVVSINITAGGRSLTTDVHFRLRDGHWVYVPGRDIEKLIPAFRELTKAIDCVTRSLLTAGPMSPRKVEYQYELFVAPPWNRLKSAVQDAAAK